MKTLALQLQGYLDHLTIERGVAANTLSSYRRDLRRYSTWKNEGLPIWPRSASTTSASSWWHCGAGILIPARRRCPRCRRHGR